MKHSTQCEAVSVELSMVCNECGTEHSVGSMSVEKIMQWGAVSVKQSTLSGAVRVE